MVRFFLIVNKQFPKGTVRTLTELQILVEQMNGFDRAATIVREIDGETAFRLATILDEQ